MKILFTSDTHYGFRGNATRKIHIKFLEEIKSLIKSENIDLLIHGGDWITNKQEQLEKTFKLFRQYIDIPIYTVFGNHDYWQSEWKNPYCKQRSLQQIISYHNELLAEYSINYLGHEPMKFNDLLIVGYDGWYEVDKKEEELSEEWKQIPSSLLNKSVHRFFSDRARLDFFRVIAEAKSYPDARVVCVTHMPPFEYPGQDYHFQNRKYFDVLTNISDFLLLGHYHDPISFIKNGCQVLTTGSDYDKPKYLVLELENYAP